jgi:hypothetical protein
MVLIPDPLAHKCDLEYFCPTCPCRRDMLSSEGAGEKKTATLQLVRELPQTTQDLAESNSCDHLQRALSNHTRTQVTRANCFVFHSGSALISEIHTCLYLLRIRQSLINRVCWRRSACNDMAMILFTHTKQSICSKVTRSNAMFESAFSVIILLRTESRHQGIRCHAAE